MAFDWSSWILSIIHFQSEDQIFVFPLVTTFVIGVCLLMVRSHVIPASLGNRQKIALNNYPSPTTSPNGTNTVFYVQVIERGIKYWGITILNSELGILWVTYTRCDWPDQSLDFVAHKLSKSFSTASTFVGQCSLAVVEEMHVSCVTLGVHGKRWRKQGDKMGVRGLDLKPLILLDLQSPHLGKDEDALGDKPREIMLPIPCQ